LFGFWTYYRFFKTGSFQFDGWGILTAILFFSGIAILTGAFKRKKEK
jgi:hypothetical protein